MTYSKISKAISSKSNKFINIRQISFLWLAETTADLILAFNRCLFVVSPSLARVVFDGKRTYIWLLISSSYAFYGLSFTPPMIFSPKYFAWFGNPYTGFRNDLADKVVNFEK
uniref:Uncharacterized protein n=1 Tax=Meloidogyne enterolobii TaxID=390850 RepID=A0A6V7WBE2_MELEN|nr:unnamed protein product [Meloidogyne enterolobii]